MSTETKTQNQTPKTDGQTAAPHNPFAQFAQFMPWAPFASMSSTDPMQMWQATQQAWQKMFTDAQGQAQKWADEYAAVEKQLFARANQAIDTWAQLAHDTIAYTEQLSSQARKLGFEAARKASTIGA